MDFEILRRKMVETQLVARDISDQKVINAFYKVPRHEFVPREFVSRSYGDFPIAIGCNQTISQPYIVALMTQALELKGDEKILEVGAGSGYQTAILAEICKEVYSVERIPTLANRATGLLDKLGYTNIKIKVGDGTEGWREFSPFDGITVTAASPEIPACLIEQLSIGGRMIIPIGGHFSQMLTLVQRKEDGFVTRDICGCTFVPLVGKYGWHGRGIKEYT
jgi:protein-L-isoaspartate(D-aspartate) O-methyltransferase